MWGLSGSDGKIAADSVLLIWRCRSLDFTLMAWLALGKTINCRGFLIRYVMRLIIRLVTLSDNLSFQQAVFSHFRRRLN